MAASINAISSPRYVIESIQKQSKLIIPKVDFINAHLAIGFAVPIIMLNSEELLDGHAIAYTVATFGKYNT